jgi:hypothetical protein
MSETTHLKQGACIMNPLEQTQTAGSDEKQMTVGSVCKVAAAAAIVSVISVFSADQVSRTRFAPTVAMDLSHQSDLRNLLCRIDRRCPSAGEFKVEVATDIMGTFDR